MIKGVINQAQVQYTHDNLVSGGREEERMREVKSTARTGAIYMYIYNLYFVYAMEYMAHISTQLSSSVKQPVLDHTHVQMYILVVQYTLIIYMYY